MNNYGATILIISWQRRLRALHDKWDIESEQKLIAIATSTEIVRRCNAARANLKPMLEKINITMSASQVISRDPSGITKLRCKDESGVSVKGNNAVKTSCKLKDAKCNDNSLVSFLLQSVKNLKMKIILHEYC